MSKTEIHPVNVHIKNFQSIEDLKIEIRGFTCITGSTNIGKSAIIRAVSRSILNDPVIGMVRKGKGHATVDLSHDSWEFKWEKGEKGINRYHIGEKLLDKTGQKQIEDTKLMGFTSVKVGDEEIQPWFARQFFPLFLLDKSGPQITDFISTISGLNVLQDAIILASRGRKRLLEEVRVREKDIESNKEELEKFSGLEILQQQLRDMKEQRASAGELKDKIDAAKRLLVLIQTSQETISFLDFQRTTKIPALSVEKDIQKFAKIANTHEQMKSLARTIIALKELESKSIPEVSSELLKRVQGLSKVSVLPELQKRVDVLTKISKSKVGSIEGIDKEINRMRTLDKVNQQARKIAKTIHDIQSLPDVPKIGVSIDEIKKWGSASSLVMKYRREYSNMRSSERFIKEMEDQLEDVERRISEIPTCPTCGQVIKSKHKHGNGDVKVVSMAEIADLDL